MKRTGKPGAARIKWGVKRRLEFIEFRLFWEGSINRADIIDFFHVSVPQASKDLNQYQSFASGNLKYDKSKKRYVAEKKIHASLYRSRFGSVSCSTTIAARIGSTSAQYVACHATRRFVDAHTYSTHRPNCSSSIGNRYSAEMRSRYFVSIDEPRSSGPNLARHNAPCVRKRRLTLARKGLLPYWTQVLKTSYFPVAWSVVKEAKHSRKQERIDNGMKQLRSSSSQTRGCPSRSSE